MISYPKLDRLTLTSVEKMPFILKDPPKSLTTRRVDKVGQTQLIVDEIDASCSRANDAISVYSRGVNPMVHVNYSNYGNTAQSRTIVGTNKQAYYPYRVVREGAFRPPALRKEDLVPLSRMPRDWTYAYTNPAMPDFSKNMQCNFNPSNQVKNEIMSVPVKPTKTFIIQVPFSQPYDVKNIIKNNDTYSVTSNVSGFDDIILTNSEPTKEIQDTNTYTIYTNLSSVKSEVLNHDSNCVPNETKNISVYSAYAPISLRGINTMDDYTGTPTQTQDVRHTFDVYAQKAQNKNHMLPTNIEIQLDRNIPATSAQTNRTGLNVIEFANRNYRLTHKVNPGGFENKGGMPQLERSVLKPLLNSSKYDLQTKTHHYGGYN